MSDNIRIACVATDTNNKQLGLILASSKLEGIELNMIGHNEKWELGLKLKKFNEMGR